MGVFSFLKPKTTVEHSPNKDGKDEEYRLPRLTKTNFVMTDELRSRRQMEQLRSKYGVSITKEGEFI